MSDIYMQDMPAGDDTSTPADNGEEKAGEGAGGSDQA